MTHSSASSVLKNAEVSSFAALSANPKPRSQTLEPNTHNLTTLWAKKYVTSLNFRETAAVLKQSDDLEFITSKEGRSKTAKQLAKSLTSASAQAWSMTEQLLATEVERHGIESELINPWQIAADSHGLYQKALDAYAERLTPRRLSVVISSEFGQVRQKYTAVDPRVLGFVSMQFHNTGKILLDRLTMVERSLVAPYFKVMDDHLYMPLRRAYTAAAEHDPNSFVLKAVQRLLPLSTRIAHTVCNQIGQLHPNYQSYSGLLSSTLVRVSSIRDVEMFQVYLCLCVLEDSISAVQEELFPLCVMLYPQLGVSWKLVQDMLELIRWEIHDRLPAEYWSIFSSYLTTLNALFSSEVFPVDA